MYDPLGWACGHCAAQPGEPCVWTEAHPQELYHAERIETAEEESGGDPGTEATPAEFVQAVNDSGLV